MKAILMLEDGKSYQGTACGSIGSETIGEVVFNTAVVGFQEMATDPANANKILVFTYPLIGNYGTAPKFNESARAWVSGLIFRDLSRMYSNWQARVSFDSFLKKNNCMAISGIDTRTLAVHLRHKGQRLGIISTKTFSSKELLSRIEEFRKAPSQSILPKASTAKIKHLGNKAGSKRIAVLDLGITNSILQQLISLGLSITLLPYDTAARQIVNLKIKGLIISGGPEEDPGLQKVAQNLKPLIKKMPILGISTGSQVLAMALGAKINRMKLGHRGINYPISSPSSYKGEITVQNHSCVADADSLSRSKFVKITGYNLNDHTVEEFESRKLKLIGVQYVPVSPGFDEVNPLFLRFAQYLKR